MAIIETEVWKPNPARPGTVVFDSHRMAQDIFRELETHLKAEGRMPDEYFLLDSDWKNCALFPKDANFLCNVNFGGSEGVYLDISLRYEKEVYERSRETGELGWIKRMVTEGFATGKTLGDTIYDLDKMNLAASSVMAAFYGFEKEVKERYAKIESGEIDPVYLTAEQISARVKEEPAAKSAKEEKGKSKGLQTGDFVFSKPHGDYGCLVGEITAITPNDSNGYDIHVDFFIPYSVCYSDKRKTEIAAAFSELRGEPIKYDDLPLGDVTLSPESLVKISFSDVHEHSRRLFSSREGAESYYNEFLSENRMNLRDTLIERIDKNYSDFNKSLFAFSKTELINMADKIHAMSDAHSYMNEYHNFDVAELEFYLQFQNPLEVVADYWHGRNSEIGDLVHSMDNIKEDMPFYLENYPLEGIAVISGTTKPEQDAETGEPATITEMLAEKTRQAVTGQNQKHSENKNLHRYMDVDLFDFLGKISEKVLVGDADKENWNHAKETLIKAASRGDFEYRRIIIHIGDETLRLRNENEIYVKGSRAFEYEAEVQDFDKNTLVYAIEFTKREGNTIIGNVFEVGGFTEHAGRIRDMALPLDSVSLEYFDAWGAYAGKKITVSPELFSKNRERFLKGSGNVLSARFNPKDEAALTAIMGQEHAVRMAYPIGSAEGHLNKLDDRLSEAGTSHEPEKTEPPVKTSEITKQKPKTLAEKMQAAQEKVKSQDTYGSNYKSHKREERE